MILGDEVFDEHFIYVPEDAPRRPTAPQINAYKANGFWSEKAKEGGEFWAEFDKRAANRMLLTEAQAQHIINIAENISKIPEAVEGLTSELIEVSMIWQDPITGVWLKSRPDCLPTNGYDFADLKTFAPRTKSIKRSVMQSITDYRYDMQMGLAVMGAEHVLGTTAENCVLIFCQSNPPYTVTPVRIEADTLYWARAVCRKSIDTFARCIADQHWPMPVEGIMDYTLPESLLHRYSEMQAAGDLPNTGF